MLTHCLKLENQALAGRWKLLKVNWKVLTCTAFAESILHNGLYVTFINGQGLSNSACKASFFQWKVRDTKGWSGAWPLLGSPSVRMPICTMEGVTPNKRSSNWSSSPFRTITSFFHHVKISHLQACTSSLPSETAHWYLRQMPGCVAHRLPAPYAEWTEK